MALSLRISKHHTNRSCGFGHLCLAAGVLIALLILAGAVTGGSRSIQADQDSGWIPSHLASSSVWLNLRRQGDFFEINLKIRLETAECHRIADPGKLERPTPYRFVVNVVKEQKTKLDVCSGQKPMTHIEPYGLRSLEPGSYEFIVQNNGDEVSRWGISVISDSSGACVADFNKDFHISRPEVTNIVSAYLVNESIGGVEVLDRTGTVDALAHYLLYGADPPPTLLCQSDTMPRWKAPLRFAPAKYVYIGKDLTVFMRTLESTSSGEVLDVSVTIKGFEANKRYEETTNAVALTCGNTRPGYIERCWSAKFQDIPDNYALVKDKIFDITVKSDQIAVGQSAIFIVEPADPNSGEAGAVGGRHIVISQNPSMNIVVAIGYDAPSVEFLIPVDTDSQGDQRQSNASQSRLTLRFEAPEVASTSRLLLTRRISRSEVLGDASDAGDAGPPTEIIVNGHQIEFDSGTSIKADQDIGLETTQWAIAHLLVAGENIVLLKISNSGIYERLEITR